MLDDSANASAVGARPLTGPTAPELEPELRFSDLDWFEIETALARAVALEPCAVQNAGGAVGL